VTVESPSEDLHAGSKRDLVTSARNAFKLGGSLLATWAVALVVRFHLPRHLGPADFGTFNFSESFAGAFSIFVGLGVENYIQKEISVRPEHASEFFGGYITLRALLSSILLAIMAMVLIVTNRPITTVYVAVTFGVAQFLTGVNGTLGVLLQASTRVDGLAITNVIAKLLWGAGIILGIWLKAPLWLLAMPLVVSELLRTMFLFPAAQSAIGLQLRFEPTIVKAVVLASLPFYLNSIAISLGSRIDVSMLGYMASDDEVGWYGAANNLASLAMLLAPILSWVLMPLLARAAKRSDGEVFAIVRRAIEGLVVLSIPVTLMIGLGADVWIRIVFGPAFAPAGMSLRVLAPIFVLTYVAMLLASALIILNRSWTLTVTSVGGLVMLPILVWILVPLCQRLGPGGAGTGASLAQILMEALIVMSFFFSIGKSGFDKRSVLAIGKSVVVSIIVIVMHRALAWLGPARIAIDLGVYIVLAFAIGVVHVGEVKAGIRALVSERRAAKQDAAK
jgi:O-antigen/teichoic acid export membrane protein